MNKGDGIIESKINAIKISMIILFVLIIARYVYVSNSMDNNGGGRQILTGVCNQDISTEDGRQGYLNCIKTLQNEADNEAVMKTTSPSLPLNAN